MAGREEFLRRVREALGRRGLVEPPFSLGEGAEERAREVLRRLEARRGEVLARVEEMAPRQGWALLRAPDPERAVEAVLEVARRKGARRAVRSAHPVFGRCPLEARLGEQGVQVTVLARDEAGPIRDLRGEAEGADLGITGVDYFVAETGTAVLVPRQGVSRLVSLLPPVHIALVEPAQVVETFEDLLALRRRDIQQGRDTGTMYLISGPSRTADIEQTLVVGVHGPQEVYLVALW